MSLIDDFNLLELPTNATEQEAKAAYRRLARRYHPDKNPGQDTTEHFQRIHDAYQNVLSAIKRSQGQEWKPYNFSERATSQNTSGFERYEFENDAKQREYVKEQQRAYEEMKRSNVQQDRAREEALRNARSTLHQRRMNALYEEMRKADANSSNAEPDFSTFDYEAPNAEQASANAQSQYDKAARQSAQTAATAKGIKPFRRHAAKAAFIASTYLATFAMGIYSADYWHSLTAPSANSDAQPYISGLYPQYRLGEHYTLEDVRLFTEPSVSSSIKSTIPPLQNVDILKADGDWLTLSYGGSTGWSKADKFGFGTIEQAQQTGCFGQPGVAPNHGEIIGQATGNSRLRILNQLPEASMLTFQSLDGQPPFSVYLHANQPFAANFIPKGNYRLVLETGSLYHHACQRFLFDERQRVVLDQVTFASTEQSLTLRNLVTP
ncbi:Chaperone protein DnaJ [Marinomonas aquimarina]|uniref:Chaperone protein DnaJ n=1 Tax=Marinomonas aquimarina TaxID=295068 RepID=A0A1A8TEG5_9GAMM|nr:J domain-containing protein [Marinomonas aquimarina]SBS31340.1 Chaperone protein DnaJ [Marinomonas aquimarina]